jgi:aubergine-like protein
MKMNDMFAAIPLKRWGIIFPRRNERDTQDFVKLLIEVAQGMHYEMGNPKMLMIADDRVGTYVQELRNFIAQDPKMIMVVLPNNSADRYAAIKKMTCIDNAIPSQVIVAKTMVPKKGNMGGVKSIATKVLIQLNCKLGGAAWMINFPLKGVMTIGFDVTHDTTDRSKSYGAFVSTMDLRQSVKFYSAVSAHRNGEEMSGNIATHLSKAMYEYRQEHGTLPEKVLFYRDGVGDGQIEYVHSIEVLQLESKLREIYKASGITETPKFCFIIVNKRINTRIFTANGRVENPKSGTIVDSHITLPER